MSWQSRFGSDMRHETKTSFVFTLTLRLYLLADALRKRLALLREFILDTGDEDGGSHGHKYYLPSRSSMIKSTLFPSFISDARMG